MKSSIKIITRDSTARQLERFEYSITSISYLDEDNTKKSPRRIMNSYKILVMLSGQARIYLGRNIYYCRSGDCVIFAPGSLYHAEIDGPDRCRFVSLNFSLGNPVQDKEFLDMLGLKDVAIFPDLVPENTIAFILNVFSNAVEEREGYYYSINLLLRRLAGLMAYHKQNVTQPREKGHTVSSEQLVLKCHKYILNHPEQAVTVEELCSIFNVSQSYMYKSFHTVTGKSTKNFITGTKLETAAKALLQTNKTIAQIAQENGYSSGYRFSALFKKTYGISPGTYRKENR